MKLRHILILRLVYIYEKDVEFPNRDVHSDLEVDRPNKENIAEERLSKYVKRHHPATQIIGDIDARPMTRNKLRNDICFLSMHEPKIVKYALKDMD